LTESRTGQQAQRQAASSQVRAVAKRIWMENAELDNLLRSVAGTLGLALPNQPSTQQQGWMRRLGGLSGPSYDRMFAQQLRLTHGELLPLITSVRAGTRNELVRSLAASAATVINRHMEYVERTGLVDYSRLPQPPLLAAAPPAAARPPAAAQPPAAARPPAAGRPAAPPAGPSPAPVSGAPQQIDQVVNTTQVPPPGGDVKAMLAALVSVAALLIALGLLGTGRRVRRSEAAAGQHRSGVHRRRHAAQRW
jgi:predicted outer membrane protein